MNANKFAKHVNLDFLYKVLGMELRDKSSFDIDKKDQKLKKGSKIFTVINLSYIMNEFHCIPTLDVINKYMQLFSHNLFFFDETQFEMFNVGASNNTQKKRKDLPETIEEADAEASEGPDEYLDTESPNNITKNKFNSKSKKNKSSCSITTLIDEMLLNREIEIEADIDVEIKNNANTNLKEHEITNGVIKISKTNKLLTLVYTINKDINLKRVNLEKKLEKDSYVSTVGLNIIKTSHYISILDLVNVEQFADLTDAMIFMNAKERIKPDDKLYDNVVKQYENVDNIILRDRYTINDILNLCKENYNQIYK